MLNSEIINAIEEPQETKELRESILKAVKNADIETLQKLHKLLNYNNL